MSEINDSSTVIITNIRRGKGSEGRHNFIYAELRDKKTNELLISATLDYITNEIIKRYRYV